MSIKRGLIIYNNQDAFHKDAYINPYPHRMRKHDLRLNSIGLDEDTLFELRRIKRRSYLQKIRFIFSDYIQNDRHLIKCLTQMPSLKKLILQIDIYEIENYEGEDAERIIAKFAIIKQLAKKLFTIMKRTIDLRVVVVDPLPVYTKIMKNIPKLNKLANIQILFKDLTSNNLSCVDNFLSSPRTKKTLTKLQSLKVDLTHQRDLPYTSPDFTSFVETIAKINSSLQSYPRPKSSLCLSSLSSESTVPILVEMLNSSPYLSSLEARLNLTEDYMLLFDKLETLDHLSSLQLAISSPDKNSPDSYRSSKSFREYFDRVKSLKELQLSLTRINQANVITYNFIDNLRVFTQLQRLSLNFDFSNVDNEALYLLAQCLSYFSDLQTFKLATFQPIGDRHGPSYRIIDLVEALKFRKSLKLLHLEFQNLGQNIANMTILKLCETLENLIELREFKLNAQSSQIDDQGIIKFAKALPKSHNLEKISIDLCFGVKIENDTLIELLKSFSLLTHLRRIDLSLSCSEINLTTYETIILLLNKLRSLSFFRMKLILVKKASDIEAKLEELLEHQHQFQKVFKFYFH